ncbi:acyl-CoA dehydrogenase family protein [Aeromicrobium sp. Leaf350]|uniref:acyl-CoA dehydrogenase family protein n=1 Tax=Aeromicrobium sp. Leaf350 TaxID=2876565 RepID=UPI001E5246C4|nr:acyl-CoA dehydrogenase family protein [Aeromicrobium sp. Leaf350]
MDTAKLPEEIVSLCESLEKFIQREIDPLMHADDNIRFFDHRREWARTDFDRDGLPRPEWEELLEEMKRRADAAGFLRYGLPKELGGSDGTNLAMAVVREYLAHRGLGLHNDLQNESSVIGNFPGLLLINEFGTDEQRAEFGEALITGERVTAFGLTEPDHGSDATWLETVAVKDGSDWIINGAKRWNTAVHRATHDLIFARTSGEGGSARGISAFLVPTDTPGFSVSHYWWTLNMPTDHGEVELRDVRVPASTMLGGEGEALAIAQRFVHENRIRQAASSLGAAQYCIDRSVEYSKERVTFGQPLSRRQAIQYPLVELHTDAALIRGLVRSTAQDLDEKSHMQVSDKVSMCNYRANRLVCEASDRAIQVHGGMGYSRHLPFEHIYRHHRRYRITEGSEEIQMRRVAGQLFGFAGTSAR